MVTCSRCSDSIETPGTRFAFIHSANAGRHSRRYVGDRRTRRKKCGASRRRDSRAFGQKYSQERRSVSQKTKRERARRKVAKVRTVISTDRTAAVELLRRGEIVALPTETVYGLTADALNSDAVTKIFEAKERPRFDPLIVHLPNRDALGEIAILESELARELMQKFWPGPLTIIFRKREIVPDIVTAGLETVAVRMSAHPIFREVVRKLNRPLAAPSANRFGRISPTTAQHVFDELSGRIPLIIDAGPTAHGIESTIIAVRDDKIDILRRGPITTEQLRGIDFQPMSNRQDADAASVLAPGQLPSHYAPKTPLRLIDNAESFASKQAKRVGLLAWNPLSRKVDLRIAPKLTDRRSLKFVAVRQLSGDQDLRE